MNGATNPSGSTPKTQISKWFVELSLYREGGLHNDSQPMGPIHDTIQDNICATIVQNYIFP